MDINNKNDVLSLIQKASACLSKGDADEARRLIEDVNPTFMEDSYISTELGHIYIQLNETGNAINCYAIALAADPGSPGALYNLATAYLQQGSLHEAEGLIRKALDINPKMPQALMNLGEILLARENYIQAKELLENALEIMPGNANTILQLARLYTLNGDYVQALAYAEKSKKKKPDNPNIYMLLADIHQQLGDTSKSIYFSEKAISLDKYNGNAYLRLATAKKYCRDDLSIIQKYEAILKNSMRPEQRSHIHFAIAKMYDDIGEYDIAFNHFKKANILVNANFDSDKLLKVTRRFQKIFTRKKLENARSMGSDSEIPVFVVGMPRSGTTLVEQIIASHPDASGAGELHTIEELSVTLCGTDDNKDLTTNGKNCLSAEEISKCVDRYLKVLYDIAPDAKRVVDKLPENFVLLGLIYQLFPHAKIIHVIRNPLDTCLSCYFQDFTFVAWSCDLDDIAIRYKMYRETVKYWYNVLPESAILDVHYENIIDHPEEEIRRIINFIGLPWNDACLDFHKTKRGVRTASVSQVRQPIYKTSKMRSRHYAKHLTGLANKLRDCLSDDPEFLAEFGIKKRGVLSRLFKK